MDRLDAIAAFAAAVETGSLSGAARALGVSLASVSRQVAALEARLGTRLLVRTTRHLAPTDSGRAFYQRTRHVLNELAEAERLASHDAAEPAGELRLAAPALLGRHFVARLIPAYLARNPRVSVDLVLSDRPVDLVQDGVDLAVQVGAPASSGAVTRRIGTVRMLVCAAPAYLARRPAPGRPEDLAGHDCVVFTTRPGPAEWGFQVDGRRVPVRVPARVRVNALDAAVEIALGGAGLARLPSWQVAEHLVAGRLVRLLAAYERPAVPVHALFPHARLLSAKVRRFLDLLAASWQAGDAAPPPDLSPGPPPAAS